MQDLDLLSGVRVLELGRFLAVPFAGTLLAELGATVRCAQTEPGDSAAALPAGGRIPLTEYFALGKESVERPRSAAEFRALAAEADIVIADSRDLPEDWSAGEALSSVLRVLPDPPRSAVADSALLCALSGVTWSIGEEGRPPLPMPAHTADFLVGSVFAGATTSLLLAGAAGRHEMLGVAALSAFVEQNSTSYRLSKVGWRREGRRAPGCAGIYPYGLHSCKDGQVVMIGRSTRDWKDIATALGAEEVLERYPDPFEIARHQADEVDAALDPHLRALTKADVMELAEKRGILAAPVSRVEEVALRDHLAVDRDYWHELDGTRLPTLPFVVHE